MVNLKYLIAIAMSFTAVLGNAQTSGSRGTYEGNKGLIAYVTYNPQHHVALPALTNKINKWNSCRTGAFSDNGKGVVVSGNCGFWCVGVNKYLEDKLFEINDKGQRIRDISISEDGKYYGCIYNYNGWYAYAPQTVYDELNHFVNKGIAINSFAINSAGEYIIIGDNGTFRCSEKFRKMITATISRYGKVLSADISGSAFILCCERGIVGSLVPSSVIDVIKEMSYMPKVIKFSQSGHYLITNGDSAYYYWM